MTEVHQDVASLSRESESPAKPVRIFLVLLTSDILDYYEMDLDGPNPARVYVVQETMSSSCGSFPSTVVRSTEDPEDAAVRLTLEITGTVVSRDALCGLDTQVSAEEVLIGFTLHLPELPSANEKGLSALALESDAYPMRFTPGFAARLTLAVDTLVG